MINRASVQLWGNSGTIGRASKMGWKKKGSPAVIADLAPRIRFYLHKEFRDREIRLYLHKEFRAVEIGSTFVSISSIASILQVRLPI